MAGSRKIRSGAGGVFRTPSRIFCSGSISASPALPPDATRFGALGAPQVFTTGNLKLDVPAPPADPAALAALQDAIGDRPVIAATSTHAGEEKLRP